MSAKLTNAVSRSLQNPQVLRTILVVTGLLIAALLGGAPHDYGGG